MKTIAGSMLGTGFVAARVDESASGDGRGLAALWGPGSWTRRTVAGLAVLLVLSAGGSGKAQGRRLALVVGNNGYSDLSDLANAVNDARAVTSALEDVGFTVETVENATRQQMAVSLARFAERLRGDDVALFYFAGHGVQVEQTNYLLPTDYAGQTAAAVRLNGFSAVEVEDMLRHARVAMLVFDACRNSPFGGSRTLGSRGLAPMEARGTLIAYAAGAGEEAADAAAHGSSNGLFTSKLVEALRVPGLTATALFQRVRREVYTASNQAQFPAVYDQLLSDFVFRSGGGGSGPVAPDRATENLFWQSIMNSSNPAMFEAYLSQFPNGVFRPLAEAQLATLRRPVAAVAVVDVDVADLDVGRLREMAEQGDAGAQTELGERYEHGRGVRQDEPEAVRWYRRAAAQGYADGQYNLGIMYRYGLGVQQDEAEAVGWYRRAAEQGHARGQYNLGVMYRRGLGVQQNEAEAIRWYRRAAEQGHRAAQVAQTPTPR